MRLGGHIEIAGGLKAVAIAARSLGYNCLQTTLGERLGYRPIEVSDVELAEFEKLTYGIELYVHLPYTINPCEADRRKRGFYKATMRRFMRLASGMGVKYAVLHPGFKKDLSEREAVQNAVKFFEETQDDALTTQLVLETDAGSKNESAIGSMENIKVMLESTNRPEIGMCIDTTHLYARGLSLWDEEIRKRVIDEYGQMIRMVHLNAPDPNVELGSHLDRHNSPFASFVHDSTGMIKDMLGLWPCILERRSLAVQREDASFIRSFCAGIEHRPERQAKKQGGDDGSEFRRVQESDSGDGGEV